MAKLNVERMKEAFQPHLQAGEELQYVAFGIKQPNMILICGLIALAILPGVIAIALLTKNYIVGLTNRRFVVLTVKGIGNPTVKEVTEYGLDELKAMDVKTSTGGLFTHITVKDAEKPLKAKFHRAFSKTNRPDAMAIAAAIS